MFSLLTCDNGSSTTAVTDVVDDPTPSFSEWYNNVTCEGVVNDSLVRNCMVKEERRLLHSRSHMHTYIHTQGTETHTRMHASTQTHTHTHTHTTHTHTHRHRSYLFVFFLNHPELLFFSSNMEY